MHAVILLRQFGVGSLFPFAGKFTQGERAFGYLESIPASRVYCALREYLRQLEKNALKTFTPFKMEIRGRLSDAVVLF